MDINLPYNFSFRKYQEPQFIASCEGINRFYKVWHRRAGKDISDVNFTVMKMMERVGNYWHMLPEYKQARKAIWRGKTADGRSYMDYFPPELIAKKRDQEMEIELINGSIWQVVGSDNIDAVRGAGPVGVVFSEFAFTAPNAWPTVEPILLENGGWAVFNTTPFGPNHAKDLWELAVNNPKWFTQKLTIDDTYREDGSPIITQDMIEEMRKMGTTEETIQREYYCSWEGSVEGAYYAQIIGKMEKDGLVTSVPHTPSYPVYVYMDIGKSDYTSIWFVQKVGREFRFIDYYQASNEDPIHHAALFKSKGYNYQSINLPHDSQQKRYGMSNTVEQQFRALMPRENIRRLPVTGSVQADIFSVRAFLPRCVFDKEKCKDGLSALMSYTKKWSDVKNCFEDEPFHNWASHGCFVGDTNILTRNGMCQIMNLPLEGEVLTSCGWKPYINPRMTKKNARLVQVRFKDGYTVKCTPEHLFKTVKGWKSAEHLTKGTATQSGLTHLRNTLMEGFTVYGLMRGISRVAVNLYTAWFGNLLSETYQRAVTFITKMQTHLTIAYPILNAWMPRSTLAFHGMNQIRKSQGHSIKKQEIWRLSGINQKREGFGTSDTPRELSHGLSGNASQGTAYNAGKSSIASFVRAAISRSIAILTAKPLIIESVEIINETADVWDITVPSMHEFSLENGALVHNSDAFREAAIDLMKEYDITPPKLNEYGIPTFEGALTFQKSRINRI